MPRSWLEVPAAQGVEQRELGARALRLGALECDVLVSAAGTDTLEVGGEPPRLEHFGDGAAPRVNGREVRRLDLAHGDRIEWHGVLLRFVRENPAALIEELPQTVEAGAPSQSNLDLQVATRVQAGLLCEMGLAERSVVRRWQEAVIAGQFDADGAAREILSAAQVGAGDLRLRERSSRLLRDLLMAPLQRGARGAGRRARTAARSVVAALLVQSLVLISLTVILAVTLVVVRIKWGWSVDGWLDSVSDLLP